MTSFAERLVAGVLRMQAGRCSKYVRAQLFPSWVGQTQPSWSFPGLQWVGSSSCWPGAALWCALKLQEPHLYSVAWENLLSIPLQRTLPPVTCLRHWGMQNLFPGIFLIIKGPSCPTPQITIPSPPRPSILTSYPCFTSQGLFQFSSAIVCHAPGIPRGPICPSLPCLLCLCPSHPDCPGCSWQ